MTSEQQDHSTREHIHVNANPIRFQSVMWAPEKGDNKARFAVETMIYISGAGWDQVDIFTQHNRFVIMFRDYVRTKEMLGYKHVGLSSEAITNLLNNLWKDSSWSKNKKDVV